MFHFRHHGVEHGVPLAVTSAALLASLVGAGARSVPALLVAPLQRDLGWSAGVIFASISIGITLSALAAPVAAVALDRFGLRAVLLTGLLVLTATLAASAFPIYAWQLLPLWSIGLGFSGSLSAPVLGAVVAARCYPQHCGSSSSFFASTPILGLVVALPFVAAVTDAAGWRAGFAAAALVTLIAACAVGVLVPASHTLALRAKSSGNPLKFSLSVAPGQRRDLLILTVVFFICGASSTGLIQSHFASFCAGNGLPISAGAGALAIMGVSCLLGGFASGWLADRFSAVWLLAFYYGLRGLALLWLPHSTLSFVELSRFSIFYGLDWAATFPALTKTAARSFGAARIGIVMSWMAVAHHAGAAAAAAMAGAAGIANYTVSFEVVGLLCCFAAVIILFIDGSPASDDLFTSTKEGMSELA
jgi:predicted MFS family arabinose efflux permease